MFRTIRMMLMGPRSYKAFRRIIEFAHWQACKMDNGEDSQPPTGDDWNDLSHEILRAAKEFVDG